MHKSWLLSAALLSLAAGCGGDSTIASRITGVYQSSACEPTPSGSFWRRYYTFTNKTWNLMTEVYTDDKCTQKGLSLEVGGEFKVPEAAAPAGAEPLDLMVMFRAATAWQKPGVDSFNSASCGGAKDWIAGIRKDTSSGCGTIAPSVTDCPTIYEVGQVNETQLFLGPATKTAADLCKPEARPAMLGMALTKK